MSGKYFGKIKHSVDCGCLNSGEIIFSAFAIPTANVTKVGGTLIFSKVPDIESFPPIEGIPKSICAFNAPNNAENGLPHLFLS